ncbi:small integral membrane protein 15 [Callorhinus ursinus]|uniref:Small integral membrane protein 15 n=4 Tax=Boreoeutheria TaxID=1437010 RepID=A0A3Q7QQS6_CALUR|nr:PREDICTED: small integral membrane protein 15 [Odobenus rosmarus divergens]XP_025748163.1 small integral membrane protein 15 [Callorhinus ursinus]XP_025748164.1 small integral membrane protein 15 [Callorhinus ursinus]XP_025748165.1 small integral membrane protein 15 [Callorhinus ursinus]XP_027461856.1 small integral membrane protein 15 [Zalophus californianus]XP_027461857.1 small integral membrane protein 15 [Zalophus californianus]XP_027461858.1 small integral membrane protein 15 [Zalophu
MVELKKTNKQGSSEIVIGSLIIPGLSWKEVLKHKTTTKMFDIKAWAEYVVEWAATDPYGFLTTVILALTPLFLASAVLSWKLAKMIEAREKEQKKKQKRQENIAKAKRLKKD